MQRAIRLGRSRLKGPYDRGRRAYEPLRKRLRGTLTREQLGEVLAGAGAVPGATVMVHVSMNEISRTTDGINALELIGLLKGILTEQGTLLVPTFPFTGTEADYLATNPGFDLRRTPSRMGLMTELFRRMPDSSRSLHPTHPVAGWGAHAAELLGTHHLGETFGELSPFCRMREHGGLVIAIGVREGFSIVHCAEYLHPQAREYAFSPQAHTMSLSDGDETIDYSFRPLRPNLAKRITRSDARAGGVLNFDHHAGLLIGATAVDTYIEWVRQLISSGSFYGPGALASR